MRQFAPLGVVFIVAGVVMIVAGVVVVPAAIVGLGIGGATMIAVGVLYIWMHGFMKDVPKAPTFGEAAARMQQGAAMMSGIAGNQQKRARLEQVGVVADATVKQARNTGMVAGSAAVVDLDLEITVPGKPTYSFTTRESVHPSALGMLLPGTNLKVRVDPDNTLEVAVDWAGSGLPVAV